MCCINFSGYILRSSHNMESLCSTFVSFRTVRETDSVITRVVTSKTVYDNN